MIGKTLSHYKVIEKIGQGGMGEVYRAEDTSLSREVAIKVLPEQFTQDPQRLARFEREAKLLASLNHPNIAAIYGLEEADGVRLRIYLSYLYIARKEMNLIRVFKAINGGYVGVVQRGQELCFSFKPG